jgi:Uma2 family endonuclease
MRQEDERRLGRLLIAAREEALGLLGNPGPWTEEEFLALPRLGNRIELFAGRLLVSPGPAGDHGRAAKSLLYLFDRAAPDHWEVFTERNVRFGPSMILLPDLVIVSHADLPVCYDASDVVLLVEIESPSSTDTDRKWKPELYAAAGIPWYLRVRLRRTRRHPRAPEVFVYRLAGDAYVEHARAHAGQTLQLTEPVQVSFDPAVLLHRRV